MASCHDSEGWNAVSRLRDFDSTPCFEEGIILSSLLSALLVASVLRSVSLQQTKSINRSSRSIWALRTKLVFILAAVITAISNIIYIVTNHERVPILQSYILEVLALASILPLTIYNHTRTRTSSTILLLFWPAYILGLAVLIRTAIIRDEENTIVLGIRCLAALFGVISYIIECFGPESGQGIMLGEGQVTEHPVITANIYSVWFFSWMTPLMKKGASQFITEDDLPSLPPKEESKNLGKKLSLALKKHTLWKALFIAYGWSYAIAGFFKVIQDCLSFLQPQLLRWLLAYISRYQESRFGPDKQPATEGFFITAIMFVASIIQTVVLHQYFQRCFETGMRVRAGLATAIYNKALVLSSDVRGQSSGDIVNLMSVDATRLQDFCTYGFIAISGPLQITLAFISLYNLLGWSAFVGVAIMVFSIPGQTWIARYLKQMQQVQMKSRDTRTRMMNEILANIKSIKLYGWENTFIRRVLTVRNDEELMMLKKIGVATSLNMTLWGGIPLLVAFSSFATAAAVSDKPLTSDIIFPSISLFMLLQFPLAMFSQVTSNIVEAVVSIQRLSTFFGASELQTDARTIIEKPSLKVGDEVLSIRHGEFRWSKDAPIPTLEDINISVRKGQLFGILGRVGSGKSSLLSAMIGDMTKTDGDLIVSGNIAYAAQNPWILSASVRDNILFSHEYEEDFYNMVLDACALRHDLSLLKEGDLTEVGEKGITLSGGQRARIALARAVYSRADIILLDDVLAAVDSHVARHLFDHVIGPNGILSTKARIVVTNSLAFLKQFDELVFVRHGIVLESGSYESLFSNQASEVRKLISGHGTGNSGTSTPFVKSSSGSATPVSANEGSEVIETGRATPNITGDEKLSIKLRRGSFRKALIKKITTAQEDRSTGMSKEHSEQGRVKLDVYARYIAAASKAGFVVYVLSIILQQVASVLSTFALRSWGEHNRQTDGNDDMWKYLAYYGGASLLSTILGGIAAIVICVLCGIRSARVLHEDMLRAVMMAPLSFFELTPTGRILNLFSRDTYVVDQVLVRVISGFFRTFAVCCSIVFVIGGSFPPFLIAVIPLGWFYYRIMLYYLATSRELKRLDAVSRSPIFAWFSESLAGLSTIRAYSQQAVFVAKNQNRIDRNQICYLPSISVNRWLAIRLEFLGALIILTASSLAMVALITTGVDAGLVGLVLSYALNATSSLNWFVRSTSEVEQNIVSVERILHYVELKPEGLPELIEEVPLEWPSSGNVEFRNYSARYRPELDLILRDVSFNIKAKEKVGICGRTGAGKSSLLLALFRIIEASEGAIFIDGIDISTADLHDLRSAISIVPQSPDLFEGTLRENVDPVGEHDDVDIWNALEQTYLKQYVESLPGGLDAAVREGGSSLSAGQRQLLCFARALLRKSKILVLDEATSAVDMDTDRDIQRIIAGPEFANITMFTIAHRLNTIIDCDRVMVLDSGKLAELDSPENLLAKKDSIFYSLAAEAGLTTN